MRIDRLDLLAFGPFTDTRLDLASPEGALHLVYGPNEAGKSTALRAVRALLYGFPHQTGDAHTHPGAKLRVGGRLRPSRPLPEAAQAEGPPAPDASPSEPLGTDGDARELLRRKGRKATLLTPDGTPVPEDVMTTLLGGAGEEVFRSMFGLDHETLRRGAEALLAGRGDVGESLYEAALGGRGIHALLAELREEKDALFRARAKKARIPAALDALQDAVRRVRESELGAEVVAEQRARLEEVQRERSRVLDRLQTLSAQRTEKARLKEAFPHARRLAGVRASLAELGAVPELPADTRSRRLGIEERLDDARRNARLRRGEAERLRERRSELPAPGPLSTLSQGDLDGLQERLATAGRAREERPGLAAVVAEGERRLAAELARLGVAGDDPMERLRQAVADRPRIKRLAAQGDGLLRELDQHRREAHRLEDDLRRRSTALAEAPEPPDPEPLARALDELGAGPLPSLRLAELEAERDRWDAPLAQALRELGRPTPGPEGEVAAARALARLAVPSAIEVDTRRREAAAAASELAREDRELAGLQAELDRVESERAGLLGAGEPPSEEALFAERSKRDDAFDRLRFLVDAGNASGRETVAAVASVGDKIRRADEVADRLRRETSRVEKLAALEAERRRLAGRIDLHARGREQVRRREAEADEAWRRAWEGIGVPAGDPEAMARWLGIHARLVEAVDARERLAREAAALAQEVEARAAGLRAALDGDHDAEEAWPRSLSGLVEAARRRRAALEEARGAREAERAAVVALEARRQEAAQALREVEARLEEWRGAWGAAVASLGCGPATVPADAIDRLDRAGELVHRGDELRGQRQALAERDAELAGFDQALRALARRVGYPLTEGEPPEAQARALLAAARDARKQADDRAALDAELDRQTAEAVRFEDAARLAEDELGALFAEARVADRAALLEAEDRAEQARRLTGERRDHLRALAEAADGADPEPLLDAVQDVRLEDLRAELDRLDREIEDLGEERRGLDQEVGSLESGLRQMVERAGAAPAAEAAAAEAAAVARAVDRYVELTIAIRALTSEIERYRDDHQGPLVARASELFPRLTLGRYAGLSVDFGDQDRPVLRALRGDRELLDVEALSDGTRDQLYLALRLATIERWVDGGREPLPLVLDDTFVHFDSDRSRAALGVLGELSPKIQVLLFTHHDRMVDLAREAVPTGRLRVHTLDRAPVARAPAPAG